MYLNRTEEDADRAKNHLGWCDARRFFRDIQDVDGCIQRGDDIVVAFLWLGICVHSSRSA